MVVAIDNFFGCYLLYCTNPKYKGRTYIGFTVNPERRIGQHNAGKQKGGAWKTSGKGPWDMTLIVHGFPSDVAALRFEWAWQNPGRSIRLKHVKSKQRKETGFQYRVRVMASMLAVTPWKKLPLTVRWLKQEYAMDLDPYPPQHMPIAYGPVTAKLKRHKTVPTKPAEVKMNVELPEKSEKDEYVSLLDRLANNSANKNHETEVAVKSRTCYLCNKAVSNDVVLKCINDECSLVCDMLCLAKHFLKNEPPYQLLPVEAPCPLCKASLLWGDLIREAHGFRQYLSSKEYEKT